MVEAIDDDEDVMVLEWEADVGIEIETGMGDDAQIFERGEANSRVERGG